MDFNIASGGTATAVGGAATPTGPGAVGHTRRIVLLGNPNVGKSALFNALTGLRATVSNYPGTTVEVYRGRLWGGTAEVIDSPGLNSLVPLSEDERTSSEVTRSSSLSGSSELRPGESMTSAVPPDRRPRYTSTVVPG